MEQDNQQQFISWLAQKLGAKDENDLKSKIQSMGQDGIKQAYNSFMQEQNQQVASQRSGGKLEYLRCLQAFKSGGAMKMKECGCGGKMKKGGKMVKEDMDEDMEDMQEQKKPSKNVPKQFIKHQAGGAISNNFIPVNQPNTIQVDKGNGVVGPWGNAVQSTPRVYALHPMQGGVNQIDESQLTHLRNNIPNFDQVVGKPIGNTGDQLRYGPDQSDIIRRLLQTQSKPAPGQGQQLVSQAKGGMLSKKDYMRKDISSTPWGQQGARGDEDKTWQSQGSRKDKNNEDRKAMGERMDKDISDAKAKKKYARMDNGKKEHSAVTQVPKGKEGMATPAQKKMIMLKEQDAKKGQDGMSMPGTPAMASQTMKGVKKKRAPLPM